MLSDIFHKRLFFLILFQSRLALWPFSFPSRSVICSMLQMLWLMLWLIITILGCFFYKSHRLLVPDNTGTCLLVNVKNSSKNTQLTEHISQSILEYKQRNEYRYTFLDCIRAFFHMFIFGWVMRTINSGVSSLV